MGIPPAWVRLKEAANLALGKHRRLVFQGSWEPVLPEMRVLDDVRICRDQQLFTTRCHGFTPCSLSNHALRRVTQSEKITAYPLASKSPSPELTGRRIPQHRSALADHRSGQERQLS